jgi:hypothetical protein
MVAKKPPKKVAFRLQAALGGKAGIRGPGKGKTPRMGWK